MIDDWQYVSLVMDRLLMYIYFIVTVIATCTILIRTSVLVPFDQAAYKEEIRLERFCKEDQDYQEECEIKGWYEKLCVGENKQLHPYFIGNPGWGSLKGACEQYIREHVV